MAATWQATGTGSETSCSWPTHQADDWGLLWVESASGTVTTPTDWTHVCHIANGAGSTVGALFKRLATSGAMAAASLAGGSDHLWGVITTVRGADLTDPIMMVATGYAITATTTGLAPGVVTDEANAVVIQGIFWALDNAGPLASSWTNASLDGGTITEQYDAGTITAGGGGITLASGTLATAGVVAPGTVTLTSTTYASITVAIRSPRASSGVVPSPLASPFLR